MKKYIRSERVTASANYDTKLIAKWLKAKFDDEAFGTAYTTHRISDADAYMGRNGLTYNRRNNTIDLWKSGGDEDIPVFKVIPQYSSTKRQGTYAPKLPKLVPIDEWNAAHNIEGSTRVTAGYSEDYFDFDNFVMRLSDKLAGRKISDEDARKEIQKYCDIHKGCKYDVLHTIVYDAAYDKTEYVNDTLRDLIKKKKSVTASDTTELSGLNIDMWYGDKFEPMKYGADAYFSDMDCVYYGNIYDDNGKIIGDYSADDSVAIEKNFKIDWGE
jgi:hypothetical protein